GRLGGEGLQDLDDLGGEHAGPAPRHDETSDGALLVEQRDRQDRARPRLEQRAAQPALVGAFGRDVRDLQGLARHRHLANGAFAIAITAWSAKVWRSAISSSVKPPGSRRFTPIDPSASS